MQIAVCFLLPFHLQNHLAFSQKMLHILPQAARHRVQGAHAVFQLVGIFRAFCIIPADMLHQLCKCNIILYIPMIVRIRDFGLFCHAGADKCKVICNFQIFFYVYRHTHHRALHRHHARNQLRDIFFHIIHDRRAWLADASCKMMLCDIFQISPGCNICTKRYTVYMPHAQGFQISEHAPVLLRIIGQKRRCNNNRYLPPAFQIRKKCFRIIVISPGSMAARL